MPLPGLCSQKSVSRLPVPFWLQHLRGRRLLAAPSSSMRRATLARAAPPAAQEPPAKRPRVLERPKAAVPKARAALLPRAAPRVPSAAPASGRHKALTAGLRAQSWSALLSLATLAPAARLPEREVDLQALPQAWQRRAAADSDDDCSTSDEPPAGRAGERRERELQRRASKRLRSYGAEALLDGPAAEGQSFLERRSVFAPARRRYGLELDAFLAYCGGKASRPLRTPTEVDEALVDYLNALFFQGHESSKGDQLMAGLMYRFPDFSKQGEAKTPRAWRCLRGWRKLAPGRSRRAWPLALWCGLAERMVARGALPMAVFLLTMVSGYFRPSHLLTLTRGNIIAPAPGLCRWWSLLLFPDDKPLRSKTGLADVGVMLDSPWFQCAVPIFRELARGDPSERVWEFSYPQFLKMFKLAIDDLKIDQHIVPYQARHSGPSIDVARHYRPLDEIQKRGQWKHAKSMQRYEKAARLGQSWSLLPRGLRDTLTGCEHRLGDILLGRSAGATSR